MKTGTKKLISLLISLAVILTALPLAGVTAFAEVSGDFEYTILEDGTAEITDYTGNAETLEIPSKLDTYTVTSIGYEAFAVCYSLTSVTIPNSVTNIGDDAFKYCYSLTEINVDANNKNYSSQDGVLFNKNKTELIQYPIGNTRTSYDIPNSVTNIGDGSFDQCGSLISVTIPNSVTRIGVAAFFGCDNLTSVSIPDSVISIDWGAFCCYSLTEINVDANNKNYSSQDGVLFDKNKTELIQYPMGNTRTSYDIPDGVTSIGDCAFQNCNSLTSVTIPESVTNIYNNAFENCDGLTEIKVDASNKNYSSQDGVLFNKNKTVLLQYPIGNTRTSYDVPNGVTSISDWAFAYCDSLTSVTIGNGVTSIGYYAFEDCDSLTSVTIPDSVANIGDGAFRNTGYYNNPSNWKNGVLYIDNCLVSAKSDEVPQNYKINGGTRVIANDAFWGCDSLTSVTIPDSVISIGSGAFSNTGYYNNPSNWENGVLYVDNCLIDAKEDEIPENYTINNGTRVIADEAFGWCDSLTSVIIPNSVTHIGDDAFFDCYDLISVTIPDSVTSIGDEAFSYCYSLTDIYILNKECSIASSDTIPTETTIHGYTGSTAESYAKEHGNNFVDINSEQELHNMVPVPAKAATCTEDGNIEYYHCSACNKNFKDINGKEEVTDVVVKATGHNMTQVPAKAATCTEDGNIEYYHCPDCNKNFKDKDGKEEVTDVVVKATGHNYENGVCTVCGEKDPNAPKPTGEVSGDGKLSTVDAKWILQNIAKSRDFSDEQSKAADLNGDGKLSVVDVKWVLQIVAGMRNAETLELITK